MPGRTPEVFRDEDGVDGLSVEHPDFFEALAAGRITGIEVGVVPVPDDPIEVNREILTLQRIREIRQL